MRPPPRAALCLVLALVLALGACGPDAPRDPADAPPPAPAPPGESPDPHRAARPVPANRAPLPPALQRALDVLASPDSDAAARVAAESEVLSHGAVAAEALIDWLQFHYPDDRALAAHRLLRELGAAAVRPLLAVVRPCGDTEAERGRLIRAVALLHDLHATWSATDLAADVAAAALAVAESNVIPSLNDDCLLLLLDAGPAAAPLAPRLLAHILGEDGEEWIDDLDDRPRQAAIVLAPVAADLVPLLAAEEWDVRVGSQSILSQMDDPPRAAVEALLAAMSDPEWEGRTGASRVVAAWSGDDPRLLDAARLLLADPDADVREQVLRAWRFADGIAPEDAFRAARAVLDDEREVADAARTFVTEWLAARDDRVALLDAALRRSGADDVVALCTVVASLNDADVDPLVPALAARTSSNDPRVRAAALRAIDGASWDVWGATAPERSAHLDDPDPAVRAWAAWSSVFDDTVPPERIAAVALPLVRTLEDPDALVAAFRALRSTDEAAAAAEARRLLGHQDRDVRWWAETCLADAPADAAATLADDVLRTLLDRLQAHDEVQRTLAILLRSENGPAPGLAWFDLQLAVGDRRDVVVTLGYVLGDDTIGAHVLPSIRRLAAREGFADLAEAALAWFETDPAAAIGRFESVLQTVATGEARDLIGERLTDLGPAGAALLVRMGTDPDSWEARAVVRDEPETVRATIAELATSRSPDDRRIAARWAGVFGPAEAMRLLRTLARDEDLGVRWAALELGIELAGKETALVPEVATWCVPAFESWTDSDLVMVPLRFLAEAPRLPDGAAMALGTLTDSKDADVRASAAAVLCLHDAGDDAALRTVVARLRPAAGETWGMNLHHETWQFCARAIERAGPAAVAAVPDVGAVLARALVLPGTNPWKMTQELLVRATGALGPAAAPCVPILRTALFREIGTHDEGGISQALSAPAARALGQIGAPAASAIPDLRRLAKNPRFRAVAEEAIRAIEAAPH